MNMRPEQLGGPAGLVSVRQEGRRSVRLGGSNGSNLPACHRQVNSYVNEIEFKSGRITLLGNRVIPAQPPRDANDF